MVPGGQRVSWEWSWQPTISADPATLTPLYDFVLVKPFPKDDGLIINPGVHMTGDFRWRSDRPRGNRFGAVVAVGKGDRMVGLKCEQCDELATRIDTAKFRICRSCGGDLKYSAECEALSEMRAPMHVVPGDVVVFPRVPANEILINQEEYVMLHEEQHILAVVDRAAA